MMLTNIANLQDSFLIAMPSLNDNNFRRAVTYIFNHDAQGTAGLIINQPLNISFEHVLKQLGICDLPRSQKIVPVCRGGPVEPNSGFLLHMTESFSEKDCIRIGADVSLATSKDFLEKFAVTLKSVAGLFAIGHASWAPGQLESEISRGFWLCSKADKDIIFKVPFEQRWNTAIEQMGVDISHLSSDIGHA